MSVDLPVVDRTAGQQTQGPAAAPRRIAHQKYPSRFLLLQWIRSHRCR